MTLNKKLHKKDDSTLFRSLVDSLIYLTNIRPDNILHAVSMISSFMNDPSKLHYATLSF